jgi:hypothetical protein
MCSSHLPLGVPQQRVRIRGVHAITLLYFEPYSYFFNHAFFGALMSFGQSFKIYMMCQRHLRMIMLLPLPPVMNSHPLHQRVTRHKVMVWWVVINIVMLIVSLLLMIIHLYPVAILYCWTWILIALKMT